VSYEVLLTYMFGYANGRWTSQEKLIGLRAQEIFGTCSCCGAELFDLMTMTPRDECSSSGDLPKENQAPSVALETVSTEESDQIVEEWAQAEGYTPLSEVGLGRGAMFMAMPLDNDGRGHSYEAFSEGSFFADMNAFDSEHDAFCEEVQTSNGSDEPADFRQLAEQALKALEEDYTLTLGGINLEDRREDGKRETVLDEEAFPDEHVEYKDLGDDAKSSRSALVLVPTLVPCTPPAEIDTVAVQRAVASIQLKDAKLSQRYKEWEQTLPPEKHDVIPSAPLAAFRKTTAKARQATSNLSRSATIAHALHRLHILQSEPKRLLVHILGVDYVETKSVDQIRVTFGPLIRWLAASPQSPESIDVILIGPNVVQQPRTDLLPRIDTPLKKASVSCHVGAYHELHIDGPANLTIAFNAGIWGYREWVPTLERLKGAIFVVTAYTLEEAEDDAVVLSEQPGSENIWKAESNPFGSNVQRETKSLHNRIYRENAAWQAWKM
jgi:hypothetical protein